MRLLDKADIIKIAKIIKNCFFHDEMTSVAEFLFGVYAPMQSGRFH